MWEILNDRLFDMVECFQRGFVFEVERLGINQWVGIQKQVSIYKNDNY